MRIISWVLRMRDDDPVAAMLGVAGCAWWYRKIRHDPIKAMRSAWRGPLITVGLLVGLHFLEELAGQYGSDQYMIHEIDQMPLLFEAPWMVAHSGATALIVWVMLGGQEHVSRLRALLAAACILGADQFCHWAIGSVVEGEYPPGWWTAATAK